MDKHWLAFLSIGVLGLIVFIFFWYRNQPIEFAVEDPTADITQISEPSITFVNPRKGAEEASITIVEFGDFECTACKTLSPALEVALKTYPDDVNLVWKNLPNESIHPIATPAAIAAHCADQQGAFWAYHDILFDRQGYITETQFPQIAQEVGIDVDKFSTCYETRDTLAIVKKDYEEGLGLGLTSTPTLFIEGQILIGAITTNELLDVIETLLP